MTQRTLLLSLFCLGVWHTSASAYVEAPHTLGRCVHESTTIVVMEVTKVNKEKGLILFKKIRDLKGKHPVEEIKHNIGQKGFHPREWQTVMAWAEPGKQAVFFYNNEASETCLGTYWYQCYREGDWWGMTHAEPFLLRTFYGEADTLVNLVERILKNEEVIAPCMADANKDQLHLRKGKLQRLRASLKRIDYDTKRDFVGFGGLDGQEEEFKTTELLAAGAPMWKQLPAAQVPGDAWTKAEFDDAKWRDSKAPIGYGEEELTKRQGTLIPEIGVDFAFRRSFNVPADMLQTKNATFRIGVASDDGAKVFLNGQMIDDDTAQDHEFAYWNREIEVPVAQLKPGKNVLAIWVKNKQASSDLYFDVEVTASVPLPKKKPVVANPMPMPMGTNPMTTAPIASNFVDGWNPQSLVIDKNLRTITLLCRVAPRKLPNLDQQYPIEVIATYPAPRAQKAHETIVTFQGCRPSDLHRALLELGLKPGRPAIGGVDVRAEGPELKIWFEVPADGGMKKVPLEQTLIHRETKQAMIPLKWHFTGSAMKQPDPERDESVYGADMTGTLISLFPVTDATVIQSHLSMAEEPKFKLETLATMLPKEGGVIRLVIQAP